MGTIFCACCGRPFQRATQRGRAPSYCSDDCRKQMAVRRLAWGDGWRSADQPFEPAVVGARQGGDAADNRQQSLGDD